MGFINNMTRAQQLMSSKGYAVRRSSRSRCSCRYYGIHVPTLLAHTDESDALSQTSHIVCIY